MVFLVCKFENRAGFIPSMTSTDLKYVKCPELFMYTFSRSLFYLCGDVKIFLFIYINRNSPLVTSLESCTFTDRARNSTFTKSEHLHFLRVPKAKRKFYLGSFFFSFPAELLIFFEQITVWVLS